ncbi:helix-turn-helix domain-containing protein [Streptodolium elevatio]|uniref:Helix-turn-helix transcriptional regulator n=1 Tax=Streptodolium elevatio TaxID=3157996 RepID=A0ABV3DBF5_9ACTN
MSTEPGPTLRKKRLAAEFRRMREAAGLTCEEVAERLLVSASKISRIETGHRGVSLRDARDLMDIYGVTDKRQREATMELAREARRRGWWSAYSDLLPGPYIGLESEASSICNYQTLTVPGLLQIEEYAQAVIGTGLVVEEAEVARRTAARMRRQERLGAPGLAFWAVLDEAAVRRPVGGSDVMVRQLDHLIAMARLPAVTIQVLPFAAGAYPSMGWPFVILSFPDQLDHDVVMVENSVGELYLEKSSEVERFRTGFEHFRAAALSPADTLTLLREAARDVLEC